MSEPRPQITVTPRFIARLQRIEAFLKALDAPGAWDTLLHELRTVVLPNLRQFPQLGSPYLETLPQSTEALMSMARMPRGSPGRLRRYVHGDYVILYLPATDRITLLSIRHHRESVLA
jgi:plasmid stabilization system protein ParE